jgi:hypothetical protein
VAITAGQAIYYDRTTLTYKLADADTELEARCAGVAVCDAAAGQYARSGHDPRLVCGDTVHCGKLFPEPQKWQVETAKCGMS